MATTYHIHPGIGIARLGNSPDQFCISPESEAQLPIDCDNRGNPRLSPDGQHELRVGKFKDCEGRIKRQAARFQIFVRDEDNPEGRPLKIGDRISGGGNHGTLVDIKWRVYLANKKASWYEFQQLEGEHGYDPSHPRRNADITDGEARQRLIIDPGPQIVDTKTRRQASFSRDNPDYAPSFPPPLSPFDIDTLGEILTDDDGRLLVLGGHGHSGSMQSGFGHPRIDTYANNDGWFDDTADGSVMARLVMYSEEVGRLRFIDVEYPAWVIVGYPAYVPEILDIVTADDVLVDLGIREMATRTDLYGVLGTFDDPQTVTPDQLSHWKAQRLGWNSEHKPWFYRDVWPILFRADEFTYLTNVLMQSNYPHNASTRGTFDPDRLSVPPTVNRARLLDCRLQCMRDNHSGQLFADALSPVLGQLHDRWLMSFRDSTHALRNQLDAMIDSRKDTPRPVPEEEVEQYRAMLQTLLKEQPARMSTDLFVRARKVVLEHAGRFAQRTMADDVARNVIEKLAGALPALAASVAAAVATPAEGQASQAREASPEGASAGATKADATSADATGTHECENGDDIDRACTNYARNWRNNYRKDNDEYSRARRTFRDQLDKALVELRDESVQDWQGAIAELVTLVSSWGPTEKSTIESYSKGRVDARTDVPWDQLRSRAHQLVRDYAAGKLLEHCERDCYARCTYDPYRDDREYLFSLLRQPGEENEFRKNSRPNSRIHNLPLMPLLNGDNPISNTLPSKFLRLTDYQLYILRQWSRGMFYNEVREGWVSSVDPWNPYGDNDPQTGIQLDHGVLSNVLGGAFCPGGEVGWIVRNPSIYREPYRIKANPDFYAFRQTAASDNANASSLTVSSRDYESYTSALLSQNNQFATGLEPGDMTKYMALPWQADFNECTTQDVDVTYLEWNKIYPVSDDDGRLEREQQVWETLWWPAHRPLQTWELVTGEDGTSATQFLPWSRGIPQTNAGDLKMVSEWSKLGFVVRNASVPAEASTSPGAKYISVERSDECEDKS